MTELGEIPNEWKIKKLSDVSEIIMGQSPNSNSYNNDGIGIAFFQGKTEFGRINPIVKKWCSNPTKISKPLDILISVRAPVGAVNINNIEACIGRGLGAIRQNEFSNYRYLYYAIQQFQDFLLKSAQGSTFEAINSNDLKSLKIPIPSLGEQEKIAEILSTVDEQIENTEKLIQKNQELKKGLMQQLLTKGIGHTEFKKTELGDIPKEWEIMSLGDVSIGKGEYGIGASAVEYIKNKPRYLRITDIGDKCNLLYDDIKGLNDDNFEKYLLKYGDVVFARTGNTTGKAYVYNEKDGELVYAGFLIKFKMNHNIIKAEFFKYIVQSKRYWNWVNVMSIRSGQPGINSTEYSKFLIQIPKLNEQEKIAKIISIIDEQIDDYQSRMAKLEKLKKGLMQNLLTGKLRVI
nr:restriction endonuclease subunit S [Clostridium perfringens]